MPVFPAAAREIAAKIERWWRLNSLVISDRFFIVRAAVSAPLTKRARSPIGDGENNFPDLGQSEMPDRL
jgi:hypothetical protein